MLNGVADVRVLGAHSPPEAVYEARCEAFARERDALARRSNRLANLRLLLFAAAAVGLGWAVWTRSPVIGLGAALLVGGFVFLVVRHRRVNLARRRFDGLWRINDEARRRLDRDWDRLPVRHARRADPEHPYAADLDVFGRASLLHLLESVGTAMGEQTLGRWLLRPAAPDVVRERQAAVAELAPQIDWRDELVWRGRLLGDARPDPAPLLAWAEGRPWLRPQRGILWAARICPPLLWATFLAQVTEVVTAPLWLVFAIANLLIGWRLLGTATGTLDRVGLLAGTLGTYADGFGLLSGHTFRAPALRRVQAELTLDGVAAAEHVRRLERLTALQFPRTSMVSGLVQMVTLWDVHVLDRLEGWQVAVGPRARDWLAALGEAEALAALGQVAHDNPAWAFPEIDPDADALEGRDLGHPLLPPGLRVANDVTVGPPGTFLLVTGSNMSGKSTLLRAIGTNVVLAGAGGPVCASALRLPPVELWTSMRIQDSLERGVSFFMAELQRLKAIVDAARATAAGRDGAGGDAAGGDGAGGRTMLYLLDEILQGTNTNERQIAARRIIDLLIRAGALGAVSTHDLTLADAEPVRSAARAIHLTEMVTDGEVGPRMSFDYKVRPGIATSTNALRLLEMVGIPRE